MINEVRADLSVKLFPTESQVEKALVGLVIVYIMIAGSFLILKY